MSNPIDSLMKRYNLDEDDFWFLAGNRIISFDGVSKIIDIENVKFEMSNNLDVSPSIALKVVAYIEPNDHNGYDERIEETTFGEANDTNCRNQYFWAMAEKRGKARATLKLLGLYGKNAFYSDVEAEDFQKQSPTIKQIEAFVKLEKQAVELGVLDENAKKWLKDNTNAIRQNLRVYEKATASLEKAIGGR